jgi:hypothetical protein
MRRPLSSALVTLDRHGIEAVGLTLLMENGAGAGIFSRW